MRLAYQSCRGCPRLSLKCGRTRPFSSPGGLAERFNAADLKSASPQGLGGSNPSPSATCSPATSHRVFFSALSLYESAPVVPSERGSNEELDLPLKQQRKGARNGPPSYRDVKLQERLQNAIGVNAQREIEQAVQTAMQQTKPGSEALIAKMTLEIPAIA